MLRTIKKFKNRLVHRPKAARSNQAESPANTPPAALESPSAGQPSIGKPHDPVLPDLWQSAYDRLDPREQHILSRTPVPTHLGSNKNENSPTAAIIDRVIQKTKEQYELYRDKGLKIRRSTGEDIDLRSLSHKIINAALSFKSMIDAVVALDPTNHAASVWAVVSLGLTMSKNRIDLRDALFDSTEYLADVLARHAYIEKYFYHSAGNNLEIGQAIVKVYTAILRYTAEVLDAQTWGIGRRMLDSATEIDNQRVTELKASVNEEELNLHQWIQLDQFLQHGQQAESILDKIDKMSESLQSLVKKFSLPIADGASYDSYMNQHDDLCLPETRVELRSQISEWAESADSKCIFWLNGMAGTGKSTIARTVAHAFREKGQLGASFFFKKGEADRGNAQRLISTIAKQLMASNRQLAHGIFGAMESETDIATKSLRQQFDILLLQPLLNLELNEATSTVIVIDALDECEQEDDINVILELLPQLQKPKSQRVKIFLTSRPELAIRLGFEQNNDHQDLVLHELPQPVIEGDIRIFVKDRLKKIQRERSLPRDWPGEDISEILVTKSVPLFIFAATICRFIGEKYQDPEDRLDAVLRDPASTSASQMERMYLPVLNKLVSETGLSDALMKELKDVLGVIILAAAPLSASALARLVNTPERRIRARLAAFYSVLHVPSNRDGPVRILHLSFREFLLKTTSVFHVDQKNLHRKIALYSLRIMNLGLKHNICGLTSYGTQRADIARSTIDQHLPSDLQYSCRYWVYHLERGATLGSEIDIYGFLQEHFLHWLEAMSLMGLMSETVGIIGALQSRVRSDMSPKLSRFLHDAKRFIPKNMYIANTAPLQLYCSGLAFSPQCSIIREVFEADQRWFHIPPQEKSWSAELQTLEGHSDWVQCVAFSPDGQMVASGSRDETIRLWDAKTGEEVRTLAGHTRSIESVAFSPDGRMVASGSDDQSIKLWEAKSGEEVRTLAGHSDWVHSVAFSPDGQIVASGSRDQTIKLWDAKTGEEVRTLAGHSDWVHSVAFSPDGQIVASGSRDQTIKLWDAKTGGEVRTLTGHSHSIQSVAFSPDGRMVASGSRDRTIKLWDAQSGGKVRTLAGYSRSIESVAFSPDGQLVASGSCDKVIKLWDAKSGEEFQTLAGHLSLVQSVAFSPDGQLVATGTRDQTIKLWDAETGEVVWTLAGHTGSIESVAFSPDGQMVASGSRDKTIKLWDAKTGEEVWTLAGYLSGVRSGHLGGLWSVAFPGHSRSIYSVAFSPDGQIVASGSRDQTIKLWDAKTGEEVRTLAGHSGSIYSVAFSPDGQVLASGSDRQTIKLWDAKTTEDVRNLVGHLNVVGAQNISGHSDLVKSVAISPDGQMVASGSRDGTIKLWDAKTGEEVRTLADHTRSIESVAFSPDGRMVASGSDDQSIKLWEAKSGEEVRTLAGHSDWVHSVAFSPDGQMVASGYRISVENDWLAFAGEKVVWLPSNYRQFTCFVLNDNTLVLGYGDGRVSIMNFRAPKG